jgi:hypothetical protein
MRRVAVVAALLLAVNPGLALPKDRWRCVGYQGGSEPGVLSMSWLRETHRGEWFVLGAVWNDPQASVELVRLSPLLLRAAELLR